MISIRPPRLYCIAGFARTAAVIGLMLPLAGCSDYEKFLLAAFKPFACAASIVDPVDCAEDRWQVASDALDAAQSTCGLEMYKYTLEQTGYADPGWPDDVVIRAKTTSWEQIDQACAEICPLWGEVLEAHSEYCDDYQQQVQSGQRPSDPRVHCPVEGATVGFAANGGVTWCDASGKPTIPY